MNEAREDGLKVLTFDGEADIQIGVLSALYALLDMMRRVAYDRPELATCDIKSTTISDGIPEALPCKCFDLVVGSGDGGWIAIMLGRLCMSTSQAIEEYLRIRSSIHDLYLSNDSSELWDWDKDSNTSTFEAMLQKLVSNQVESGNAHEMLRVPVSGPFCRTVVLAMHRENSAPHAAFFRNYIVRKGNLPNYPIWFAIRATASSFIFPPAQIQPDSQRYLSASSFNFNNPINEAVSEAIDIAKYLKITGPPIACLVSLGVGYPGNKTLSWSDLGATAIRLMQDALRAHEQVQLRFAESRNLRSEAYFRFNVEQGLQKEPLHDINEATFHTHTQIYLQKVDVDQSIDNVVKHIINRGSTDYQHIISSTPYVEKMSSGSAKPPTPSNKQAARQHLTALQSHEKSVHFIDSTSQGQINAKHTEPAVREEIRKDDSSHPPLNQSYLPVEGELTRMIGYITAIACEDWDELMEVCERASLSESNAKEAVRALRREFKYGGGSGGPAHCRPPLCFIPA
ncbi:hypothetical protein DL96DRAFT_1642775 [Flagelloscypha sp. PMI_526]|nr:hypothetical protein DL96DRAFT_1642775 [Flagelloscypha sp. PMI_526]